MSIVRGIDFMGRPKIGVVEIRGGIFDSRKTMQWLHTLEREPTLRGIFLLIDSPGGSVASTQEIYEYLQKIKKKGIPVVAHLGSIATSGGYYIACAADSIFCEPGSVTGSIGAIINVFNIRDFLDKVGIKLNVVKSARYKDITSPFKDLGKKEKELLEGVVMDIHEQFVEVVSSCRNLRREDVERLADGRIFTGRQALKMGLVDRLGSEDDALDALKKMAGIKEEPILLRERRAYWFIDLLSFLFEIISKPFAVFYIGIPL